MKRWCAGPAQAQVQGAAGVVGCVALVLVGVSFASAVPNVDAAYGGRPVGSWQESRWRQPAWLAVLVRFLTAVVETGALLRHGWGTPWTAPCVVVVIAPWLTGVAFVCYGGVLISRQPRARRT